MQQEFRLQFFPSALPGLAERYDHREDAGAMAAGARIRVGEYRREHLEAIFTWKTKGRGKSRIKNNSDSDIADALEFAISARSDRAAIAVLTGLNGVDIPVASAILTAIDPERFTVIDFRALEALGVKTVYRSVNLHLDYLDACRRLAKAYRVALRTLDRALWKWSEEQEPYTERRSGACQLR